MVEVEAVAGATEAMEDMGGTVGIVPARILTLAAPRRQCMGPREVDITLHDLLMVHGHTEAVDMAPLLPPGGRHELAIMDDISTTSLS